MAISDIRRLPGEVFASPTYSSPGCGRSLRAWGVEIQHCGEVWTDGCRLLCSECRARQGGRPFGHVEADAATIGVLRDTVREALAKRERNPWTLTAVTDDVTAAVVELFDVRFKYEASERTDPVNAARRRT